MKKPKPDPSSIRHAMRTLKAGRYETVFIGDTHVDATAAKRAGIKSIIYRNGKCGDYRIRDLSSVKRIVWGL